MSIKMDQDELPEYLVRSTIVFPYNTASLAANETVLAAGHHPKLRVVNCKTMLIDPGCSVESTADLKLGDATVVVADIDSGTTDYAIVTCTVTPDNEVERNEALVLVPAATGTSHVGILFIDVESVD